MYVSVDKTRDFLKSVLSPSVENRSNAVLDLIPSPTSRDEEHEDFKHVKIVIDP